MIILWLVYPTYADYGWWLFYGWFTQLMQTMADDHSMAGLPFANVADSIILDGQQNNYDKFNYINSTNNDMFTNINPDVNNMNPNDL